jgi:hypothetical protein
MIGFGVNVEEFFYEGKIEPDVVPLTIDYRPEIVRKEAAFGPSAEFQVTVFVGRVRVRVRTKNVNEKVVHDLFVPAWDAARTLVETVGFIDAIPYMVTLDRVIMPNGEVQQFALGDRSLARMHDFTNNELESLVEVSMLDLSCGLAISDLLMTLGKSHYSPIACGRVADSIARLISPHENRQNQWKSLREQLRVEEAYVRSLSNVSKSSRHGDRVEVNASTNNETAHRAWALMGRFLRMRIEGTLDPVRYPILKG